MPTKRLSLLGEKFGRLIVVKDLGRHPDGGSYWECSCTCQKIVKLKAKFLTSGHNQSCGCLGRENRLKATTTHGMSGHPNYVVWDAMMNRCYQLSQDSYSRYGGRGIQVCDRWHDVQNFTHDMGIRPSKNHSIDRINSNGNYEPSICRWATASQQQRNRRDTRMLTWQGRTQPLIDWAEELKINYETLKRRIDKGWGFDRALSTSYKPYKKRSLGKIKTD